MRDSKRIIYRPHRGGFFESMAEAKVFESVETMKEYIYNCWKKPWAYSPFGGDTVVNFDTYAPFEREDIVVNFDMPGVFDERNGWEDTRYVCVKRMFGEIYDVPQCIGMCATIFPEG